MPRRAKHSKRVTRAKRLKRTRTRSRGGAQGAPLAQAFSGVVLPSDVPILKPMHSGHRGGDGYAYQANLQPAVPVKGRRGRRRSVKRHGKARGPVGLPVGHALPPGFGQMVQSFRPI